MTIASPGSQNPSTAPVQTQTELSRSEARHRIFLSGGTIVACFMFIGLIVFVSLFQRSPSPSPPFDPKLTPPAANATPEEKREYFDMQKEIYKTRLALEKEANTGSTESLRWLTTSTFPMFSSWIGTVLAFYFASGASRATNEGYQRLLEEANQRISGPGTDPNAKLKQLKLSSQITGLIFVETDIKLPLEDIKAKIEAAAPREKLLILKEDGSFSDIVTLSDISSFLIDPALSSRGEGGSVVVPKVSLAQYLEKRPPESQQPVIFAAPTESIYEAYTKMLNQNIKNLIVTETGDAAGKVLAFLTKAEIEQLAR